ncbi:MAG: hypothetical protein P8182_05055 [Deltaproteobacteria bacterium]
MNEWMQTLKSGIQRVPLLTNGQAMLGLTFAFIGVVVGWAGILQLVVLWRELSAYLPFSVPKDASQRIILSFPLIFNLFISTISSTCAVLVGALWLITGLADAFQSRKADSDTPVFKHPELVAESLRTGIPKQWISVPRLARLIGYFWPATGLMSPVSHEIVKDLLSYLWKIPLWAVLIALCTYALQLIPELLKSLIQHRVLLVVPSAAPLYYLLGLVLVVDVLVGVSIIPFKKRAFNRVCRVVTVRGRGDRDLLFALIEQGCRLLTPRGFAERSPIRVQEETTPRIKGTLIENFPVQTRALSSPAAYVCLALMIVFLSVGFLRLIHFHRPVTAMAYTEFFSSHLLLYALDVAFYLGLILCGLHFARWARRLFSIRRFVSSLVFCYTASVQRPESSEQGESGPWQKSGRSQGMVWKITQGADDEFAAWARQPQAVTRFEMEACWGEALSEAAGANASRHLTQVQRSQTLEYSMGRILELPFKVDFRVEKAPDADEG